METKYQRISNFLKENKIKKADFLINIFKEEGITILHGTYCKREDFKGTGLLRCPKITYPWDPNDDMKLVPAPTELINERWEFSYGSLTLNDTPIEASAFWAQQNTVVISPRELIKKIKLWYREKNKQQYIILEKQLKISKIPDEWIYKKPKFKSIEHLLTSG